MFALLLIAGLLLALSTVLFFGPMLVVYGLAGARDAATSPQGRLVAGGLAAAFCVLLFAPSAASSLISDGQAVQVVHADIMGPVQG